MVIILRGFLLVSFAFLCSSAVSVSAAESSVTECDLVSSDYHNSTTTDTSRKTSPESAPEFGEKSPREEPEGYAAWASTQNFP
jgi:hypothetical protein